jgi:hypothetical protein
VAKAACAALGDGLDDALLQGFEILVEAAARRVVVHQDREVANPTVLAFDEARQRRGATNPAGLGAHLPGDRRLREAVGERARLAADR